MDTPDYTMWLQCFDIRNSFSQIDLLDPFPAFRKIIQSGSTEPLTLCWTCSGETFVIPESRASVSSLMSLGQKSSARELYGNLKSLHKNIQPAYNILHLSDLHFGSKTVTPVKIAHLEQDIRSKIDVIKQAGGSVQPVITGDLMDSPNKNSRQEFEAFRNRLASYVSAEVIYIPGNHDMRRKGFLWKKWEAAAGLEWNHVKASDTCKVVFMCFDTSMESKLARGRVSVEQFREITLKYVELCGRMDTSNYLKIALTHHHPITTAEDQADTVSFFGIHEEPLLRMENGQQLIQWCADSCIPIILHGHKHRSRFVGQEVEFQGSTRLVRAIGSGSSTGVEDKPMAFNWITWHPQQKQWTVTYFADQNGSGFKEKRLAIDSQW